MRFRFLWALSSMVLTLLVSPCNHSHAQVQGLLKYQIAAEVSVQGSFFNDSENLTAQVQQAYEWLIGSEPAPLHLLRIGETTLAPLHVIFLVDTTRHRPYVYQVDSKPNGDTRVSSVVIPINANEIFFTQLTSGLKDERDDALARVALFMAGALFGDLPELLHQHHSQHQGQKLRPGQAIRPSSRVLGERREYAMNRAALNYVDRLLENPSSFVNLPSYRVLREQFLALRSELSQKQSQDLANFPHLQAAPCIDLLAVRRPRP